MRDEVMEKIFLSLFLVGHLFLQTFPFKAPPFPKMAAPAKLVTFFRAIPLYRSSLKKKSRLLFSVPPNLFGRCFWLK
jgi:hypothetical protein